MATETSSIERQFLQALEDCTAYKSVRSTGLACDSEDIQQEAACKCWEKVCKDCGNKGSGNTQHGDSTGSDDTLRSDLTAEYVGRVVRNCKVDQARADARRIAVGMPSREHELGNSITYRSCRDAWADWRMDVHEALRQLTAQERRLFDAYHSRGRSACQIARDMHLTPATVRQRLSRIRKKLRRILSSYSLPQETAHMHAEA